MKNKIYFLLFVFIISCANKKPLIIYQTHNKNEVLIESYPLDKPDWIYNEPDKVNNKIIFVGISDKCATEKQARDNALKNSVKKFASYCGVQIKELSKTLETGFGLSSDIRDNTKSEIIKTESVVDAYVSRVKSENWYIEKWAMKNNENINNYFYIAYVKASVPKSEYDKVTQNKIKQEQRKIVMEQQKKEFIKKFKSKPIAVVCFGKNLNIVKTEIQNQLLKNEFNIVDSKFVEQYKKHYLKNKNKMFKQLLDNNVLRLIAVDIETEYQGKSMYNMFEQSQTNLSLTMYDLNTQKIIVSKTIQAKAVGNSVETAEYNSVKKSAEKISLFLIDFLNNIIKRF